ncbi:MAG: hypothetical protein U0559_01390 [Anaerolineae bacterium]
MSKRKIPDVLRLQPAISVVITVMNLYAKDCFANPATTYCGEGVRIAQVGIMGTAVVEILAGLLIMQGKARVGMLVLPPVITGSVAIGYRCGAGWCCVRQCQR